MSRRTAAIALGLVVVVAVVVHFARRDRELVVEPNPFPLGANGAEPGPTITDVEYHTPAGRRVLKTKDFGFTVSPNATGKLVLTGAAPGGTASVAARLAEYDVFDRVEKPVADLPVAATGTDTFRVEVPADVLQRGHVYRVTVAEPAGNKATYQFNVSNAPF